MPQHWQLRGRGTAGALLNPAEGKRNKPCCKAVLLVAFSTHISSSSAQCVPLVQEKVSGGSCCFAAFLYSAAGFGEP